MSYSEIFREIYEENKWAIHLYIVIALTFAIFLSGDGNIVYATAAAGTVGAITSLGGQGGQLIIAAFQYIGVSVDVATGLFLSSLASIGFDIIPKETLEGWGVSTGFLDVSFGLFDIWWVRVVCILWWLATILVKNIRALSFASGILEYMETNSGKFIELVVAVSSLGVIPSGTVVHAATASETMFVGDSISPVLSGIIIFFALLILFFVYMFVRTFFFFIRIILIPFSTVVPMLSTIWEMTKSILILTLGATALTNPKEFLFLCIVIVLISMVFFKKAYIATRYFKNIYVKPFFKKFKGYGDVLLIAAKCPKSVRNFIADKKVDILMPVYLMKKIPEQKSAKRYDRWWFVSSDSKQWICKPKFMSGSCHRIEISDIEEKNIFIQKSLRFFEIFTLQDSQNIGKKFKRVRKEFHIVFSKEYLHQFDTIKECTGFVDYREYEKEQKEVRKLSRIEQKEAQKLLRIEQKEEKRLQRLELKQKKKLAKKKV